MTHKDKLTCIWVSWPTFLNKVTLDRFNLTVFVRENTQHHLSLKYWGYKAVKVQVASVYSCVCFCVCMYRGDGGRVEVGAAFPPAHRCIVTCSPCTTLISHTHTNKRDSDAAISVISNHGDGGNFSRDMRSRGFHKKWSLRGKKEKSKLSKQNVCVWSRCVSILRYHYFWGNTRNKKTWSWIISTSDWNTRLRHTHLLCVFAWVVSTAWLCMFVSTLHVRHCGLLTVSHGVCGFAVLFFFFHAIFSSHTVCVCAEQKCSPSSETWEWHDKPHADAF